MIASHPLRARSGFTLVELLVVITVIAILASMVVPAIGFVKELANKAKCGKNQSGIFSALLAYQEGGDPGWPNARWKLGSDSKSSSAAITDKNQQAKYTAGIFEILAVVQRDNLPITIFKCPSQSNDMYKPNPELQPSLSRLDTNWGMGNGYMIPYAMDWSAPADAGSPRPLLSDRDVVNHKDKQAVVCYADGHYMTLDRKKMTGAEWAKAEGNTSPGYIEGGSSDSSTEGAPFVESPTGKGADDATNEDDTIADNIYDDNHDYPKGKDNRPKTPGAGSSRRAFMK